MARVDKGLFGFLKDRKIFTRSGDKTLREYMTRAEQRSENRLKARKGFKKAKHK